MNEQQLTKKQNNDFPTVLQRQQLQQSSKRQERQSSYQKEYCQIIGDECETFINLQDFEDDKVYFNPQHFEPNIVIKMIQHTDNYEVLKVNVRYGYFQTLLVIFNNSSDSQSHQLNMEESGSFGKVYRAKYKNNLVIKSIQLVEDDFQNIFVEAVKEYFILKVASLIKAAPVVMDIYGFNLVIFKNAVEFSMEMCDTQVIQQQSSYGAAFQVLKLKLSQLHHFNIIHNDIKPKNLAYSHIHGSYVYLDFGLSRMAKQDRGKMIWTSFTGSIQFCSKEMKDLYINASDGWIDLYYNDAKSLQNTQLRIKSDLSSAFMDSKQGKYVFRQDTCKFYQTQLLIMIKCALYCNFIFQDVQSSFFSENEHFMRSHERQLKQFMYSLPQTQTLKYLWSIYMKETDDLQSKEIYASTTSIKKQVVFPQNISQLVLQRFNTVCQLDLAKKIGLQNQNLRKEKAVYFLFNEKVAKLFTLNSYLRIFVQFIKINSIAKCFQEKIKACEVFNVLYLHEQPQTKPQILYEKIIRYIWSHIQNNFVYELYPIMLNIIQTVVILEILSEQSLRKQFQRVFNLQCLNFIEKCAASFSFVASLEYSKARLTTIYSKNTHQLLLKQLGLFIKQNCAKEPLTNRQMKVFNKICRLINIVLQQKQYNHLQCAISDHQLLKQYKMFLQQTQENIDIYINNFTFNFFMSQYDRFLNDQAIDLLNFIHLRQNRFSYLHFSLFHLSQRFQEVGIQSQIYEKLCRQLTWLGIDSCFKLYLFYKITSFQDYLQYRPTSIQLDSLDQIQQDYVANKMFSQLSSILTQRITSRDHLHDMVRIFHETNIFDTIQSLNPPLFSFIKENQLQIYTVISEFKQSTKDHHFNMLNKNIEIVKKIMFYQIKHTSKEEGQKILQKFIGICLNAICRLNCIECKSLCLIQFKLIDLHKLFMQEKRQQFLQLAADCLCLSMKNKQTYCMMQKFIKIYIINTVKMQVIGRDFEDLIYRIIKYHNNYMLCFTRIDNYNIFIHIYLHIYRFYETQEMFSFMSNIFSFFTMMNSKYYRQFFYNNMKKIIKFINSHQNGYITTFRALHYRLALEFKKHTNPYIALYYSTLLQLKFRGNFDRMILFNIARYINMVDLPAKKIIMSNYFYYFAYYLSNSQRKRKYLFNKHTINCFSKFSQRFIVKEKIKVNRSKGINKQFYRLLCKSLLMLHKNIGNVVENKK